MTLNVLERLDRANYIYEISRGFSGYYFKSGNIEIEADTLNELINEVEAQLQLD